VRRTRTPPIIFPVPHSSPRRPVHRAAFARARAWERLDDEQLLSLRFCDLGLSIAGTVLEEAIERLYAELAQRHIRLRPHCWLAEEWFSPDGVPGIAIPFYLAHPRLARLERRFIGEVEGGNRTWLMRILRHEAGHAIDSAYRLRRRRRWREVFGPASLPYPHSYRPRPGSRRYVQHLGEWYAQAHPTEDFAETFAVWLQPRSGWRTDYAGWPALRKLEFIDGLIAEIGASAPAVIDRRHVEDLAENPRTLRAHYAHRHASLRLPRRSAADELLLRMFTPAPARPTAPKAAHAIRALANPLRRQLVHSGAYSDYLVRQILRLVIARCETRDLRVRGSLRELRPKLRWLIARLAESYEERQLPRVAL
jgi:hypothetical protein